jgi:hypothetical protein
VGGADQVSPVLFAVDLCAQCKRETLPDRRRPGIVKDAHRAAAKDMTITPDPRTERIKRRKSRGRDLRQLTRELGIVGMIKLSLDARQVARLQCVRPPEVDENCPRCLARRRRIA